MAGKVQRNGAVNGDVAKGYHLYRDDWVDVSGTAMRLGDAVDLGVRLAGVAIGSNNGKAAYLISRAVELLQDAAVVPTEAA